MMTPSVGATPIPDKVLLAYGYERHTTAVHLHKALADFCEVHAIGPGNEEKLDAWIGSDLPLIWVESPVLWYPPPELLRTRTSVAWLIDTHIRLYWRALLGCAFDHAFLAQRQAVATVRHLGGEASWLPLSAPGYLLATPVSFTKREYDVAFIGSVQPGSLRARVLDHLSTRFNMAPYSYQTPAEMMATYANARVVVNIPVQDDLNSRAFEGPAAGAFLVTPQLDGLTEILPAELYGIVSGRSPSDFGDAIARALSLDDLSERASAACSVVRDGHTYQQRAEVILGVLAGTAPRARRELSRARALAVAHTRAGQREEIGELDALPKIEQALWGTGARIVSQIRAIHASHHARNGDDP